MSGPAVFTVPLHRPFADALAAGMLTRTRGDRLALARTLLILPNNRAQRAITDAFVRRAEAGLLLPRLVSIGDPDLGDRIGTALDPIDGDPIPPAIDPIARRMILARLLGEADWRLDAAEAVRLADDLARTLDQLIVEEVSPAKLAEAVPEMLSQHWQASLDILKVVLEAWPRELEPRGRIDLADRRNRLLAAAEQGWADTPPAGPVIAAGINVAAPAAARLLRRIARLPQGMVVLAGLDQAMPDEEWAALGGGELPGIETHPQYALKRLLDRMGVARGEVRRWRSAGSTATDGARGRAIGAAMTPAAFTDKWRDLPVRQRRLTGIEATELANPAAEGQAIAIAMRQAIETPGRTVALVTNDRGLAARVAAHLKRWGIDADDSAGRSLLLTPPGTLLLGIADLIAERFAPVPLLALLKHPLVAAGEGRQVWLDGVRRLDRALRGPRPAGGLDGIDNYLASGDARAQRDRVPAQGWWAQARTRFDAIALPANGRMALRIALVAIRETASALAGDEAWSRPAGRAAAELFEAVEAAADDGPAEIGLDALPALLRALLDGVAVRPPQGGHPRVNIWGLIEARLQQADLMILGGLNEGVWPSLPAPDPWLAPAIRAALGLPGLDRRIGSEAEQFAAALGAPRVLLTRARRDARAPAVASRFWLRLDAMTGGIARARPIVRWTEAIDRPEDLVPAKRPRPAPPVADRPRHIAVTKLDRLQADPFAFYADAMLKLRAWDGVDADPSAAWRGSAVHAIFDAWLKEDGLAPELLRRGPRCCSAMRRRTRCCGHCGHRACWRRSTGSARRWRRIAPGGASRLRQSVKAWSSSPASRWKERSIGSTICRAAGSRSSITRAASRRPRKRWRRAIPCSLACLA